MAGNEGTLVMGGGGIWRRQMKRGNLQDRPRFGIGCVWCPLSNGWAYQWSLPLLMFMQPCSICNVVPFVICNVLSVRDQHLCFQEAFPEVPAGASGTHAPWGRRDLCGASLLGSDPQWLGCVSRSWEEQLVARILAGCCTSQRGAG